MVTYRDIQTELERFVTKQTSLLELERWCVKHLRSGYPIFQALAPETAPPLDLHLSDLVAEGADEDALRRGVAGAMESGRVVLRWRYSVEARPVVMGFGAERPSATYQFSNVGSMEKSSIVIQYDGSGTIRARALPEPSS